MLETIDLELPRLKKKQYEKAYEDAIKELIVLQQEAHLNNIGMVVLFEGWKGAGKGSRISDIMYHLDARYTSVYVTEDFSDEEASLAQNDEFGATGYYPSMQQFWKALGTRDSMTFYDRGWYSLFSQHLINQSPKKLANSKKHSRRVAETIDRAAETIGSFERQLTEDGYLVIKFFLHISEETQRNRLVDLYANPETSWRVSRKDLAHLDSYKATYQIYDTLLSKTNFGASEWVLLNAEDRRRVNLEVVQTLVDRLKREINRRKYGSPVGGEELLPQAQGVGIASEAPVPSTFDERKRDAAENEMLRKRAEEEASSMAALAPRSSRFVIERNHPTLATVDHSLVLEKKDYKTQLKYEQDRLHKLEQQMYIRRIPMVIMYEGWDAAGKGGSIKRVAQALDARSYTIFPSPAPTKNELAHPHLWRYWTRLPKAGHVGIYDRSWYGRVLVERVEGFANPSQWARAYDEINEFERDLINWGAILLKFWVDVTPETQLQRFEDREQNPEKVWKITDEDWRNRDKIPQYRLAVEDMFRLTSTAQAPWIILESDDKRYARIKALRIINEKLEERLAE